ncbi:LuxR C-terminal-related transcriptional regulator [Solimonas sp. K1W22B-7]|uniref:LuxR C-terminal-related transcriptional regulator n=1 Tax=Solimonas sp. K1W22B-7 TaxID=2303331 RepID=UPI0013C53216|nr:LuxR C-terminal-related transcriptional regulator [Solimonas sp. K1W22B-7]
MSRKSTGALPESLITTKLNPPELDSRLISRKALVDRLLNGEARRTVISIVAAAGSGKSTLMAQLRQALRDGGVSTCWISLDADDDSPAAFATYFISALAALDMPVAQRELALQRANPARDFEVLFDNLIAQISALRGESAIFLDDFQHIRDERVLRFINKLIAHAPPSVRTIIASRARLPLDLARQRISGQLAEVEQDELNFDSTQAADFLLRSHELSLQPEDLATLLTTTEGWPTGLQLAALALRRHRGPASELINQFSGRDKDLTSYLVEAVLRSQPEAVRKFLLLTAPLRRMSPDLCQAASGHPNSAEMLAYLARSNLFVIALDRNEQWYRYHHLFAEFLQNELKRSNPEAFLQVCDHAAQWCEAQGQTTEAIQYALDGHRYEKASDLIADRAPMVSQAHGDHYTILDWMRRLPAPYHERRPEIGLSHAWSRAFSRDTDLAMALTDRVLQRLRDDNDGWRLSEAERHRLKLLARVIQAIAKACSDEIEECISRSQELRKQIPESEPFLIASICNCIGYSHFARREFESSARAAADAYLYGHRAGAAYATVWADFLHGVADVELGRLRTAQEHGHRAENVAGTESGTAKSYSAALAALLNADISTQRCEFDQAKTYMETGRSFTALFGPLEPLLVAIRNDARIHAWRGDLDAARRVLMQGQDTALSTSQPRLFLNLAIEEVTLQLRAGDISGALQTAQRARLRDDSSSVRNADSSRGSRDALQLMEARLLLAEDNPEGALRCLNLLQNSPAAKAGGGVNLTQRTLKAVALWQSDRGAEAVRELDRALSLGTPELHTYPIASAGRALLPILQAIDQRRADTAAGGDLQAKRDMEGRLISLLTGEKPNRGGTHPDAVDPGISSEALTLREIELLRLVEAGLANRQLADALLISEATVKWHLHNIYSKIGVRNRTAAATRARELTLI